MEELDKATRENYEVTWKFNFISCSTIIFLFQQLTEGNLIPKSLYQRNEAYAVWLSPKGPFSCKYP